MRIAVVHDYFTQLGGAEKVAEEIACILPTASVYSTVALPKSLPQRLIGRHVVTSWMQHLPMMKRMHRFYFPFYPLGVESLDLSEYDLVVSSSSGYGKGVKTRPDAVHVCYCHTPMRWVWEFENYSAREKNGSLMRKLLPRLLGSLKAWDLKASKRPTHYIANSKTVAERIERFYGRPARVIHPPIDVNRFRPSSQQDDYYLILARLVSYKRIDLAVEACTRLNRRLVVIGEGPDRSRLESMAGPTVSFLGRLSDKEVEHYASRCQALIFPGEEDFGMAPLEIAAAGRPTIAYRAGGATETIVDGVTGLFFEKQEVASLMDAISEFETMDWDAGQLRSHAHGFGIDAFKASLLKFLAEVGCPVPESAVIQFPNSASSPAPAKAETATKRPLTEKAG